MKILDTILGRKPAEQRFEEFQAERKNIEREIADVRTELTTQSNREIGDFDDTLELDRHAESVVRLREREGALLDKLAHVEAKVEVYGDAVTAVRRLRRSADIERCKGALNQIQRRRDDIAEKINELQITIARLQSEDHDLGLPQAEADARLAAAEIQPARRYTVKYVHEISEWEVPFKVLLKLSEWRRLIAFARSKGLESVDIKVDERTGTLLHPALEPKKPLTAAERMRREVAADQRIRNEQSATIQRERLTRKERLVSHLADVRQKLSNLSGENRVERADTLRRSEAELVRQLKNLESELGSLGVGSR